VTVCSPPHRRDRAQPSERGWKISKLQKPARDRCGDRAVMAVARADINGADKPGPQIFWMEP